MPHLKPVLRHQDPEVRMQALAALGEIGPAAQPLLPDVIAGLQDEAGGVRYAAAFALGRIGTSPEATAALEQALKQDDAFLRMVSAWAIARNNPSDRAAVERAVDVILEAFKSNDVHLRRAAARIAVDFDAPVEKVAPLLVAVLRDQDADVVGNAIEALSQLGPKALQHIDEGLDNRELRPYAIRLIQRMGTQAESAVPALLRVLGEPAESEEDVMFKREVQLRWPRSGLRRRRPCRPSSVRFRRAGPRPCQCRLRAGQDRSSGAGRGPGAAGESAPSGSDRAVDQYPSPVADPTQRATAGGRGRPDAVGGVGQRVRVSPSRSRHGVG